MEITEQTKDDDIRNNLIYQIFSFQDFCVGMFVIDGSVVKGH